MRARGLIGQVATRAALDESVVDVEARTIELSLASEYPVQRYHWDLGEFDEILLCAPENVDLERMSDEAGAPLLWDHHFSAREQIGVLEGATVAEKRLRVRARVQKSAEGDQLLTDVRDKIKRNVSVGYRIIDVELHEKQGERPRVVVTRWQPYEGSIVAAGADPTVGPGRSGTGSYPDALVRRLKKGRRTMDDDDDKNKGGADPKLDAERVRVIENETRKAEQARCREIRAIAKRFDLDEAADKAISEGTEVEAFRTLALDKIEERSKRKAETSTVVDLSTRDRNRYSVGRVVQALMSGKRGDAGFEAEVSDAYVKAGVQLRSDRAFYVPLRFLRPSHADRSLAQAVRAELLGMRAAVSKGGSGGNLVATDHLDDEYVPHLLSDLRVVQAGARILPGLIGDIDIPAGDGSYGTAQHVTTETSDAAEVAPAMRQISGSPHTIAAYTDFTRRMRLQSLPAIEAIVRTGLSDAINELVERTALNGAGSGGAPTGLYPTSGVVAADFGGTFTYADWINMWAAMKGAKGTSARLSYITSYAIAARAITTTRGGDGSDIMIATMSADGNIRIDGFPIYPTQESPQAFGSPPALHGVAFGDWTKMVLPQWGEGVEINVDEAALALKGGRRVIAFFDYDVLITLNKSFATADDVAAA